MLLRQEINKSLYGTLGAAHFALLFAIWSLLAYGQLVPASLLPTPGEVARTAVEMIRDGSLFEHALVSTFRVTSGFLLSAVIAVPLGMLMGTWKWALGFFEPMFGFIRYMPASAFIPLFILWLGLGEPEKIMVIFWGTFFQQVLMIMDVTKNVPLELIEVSYTLGARGLSVFSRVIIPASLPGIVDTLRITFGWAWTYLVVAEIVGASSGLGYAIMHAARFGHTGKIFVCILTIGLLGMITDLIFKFIYNTLFAYQRRGT
ncbi:NitT/TauT family transport system permease protein [Desulfofundulus australicus DSM 11792]|jgi:NitT/TauT family transport system permease protein|uniref:NitT/TauT family transport system permease protein n=1 Tax=Desulfofundulus australicus DSM 11792 TaxID=1121425 RepID=A0A1M4Z8T4_9FIRM|nr:MULTISPECIES: ABC transporter permease [Desulfofundulus]SHF14006.1 NitT/TauT family transport system permease protein [Desulfofundulus australicus DSM 11792]